MQLEIRYGGYWRIQRSNNIIISGLPETAWDSGQQARQEYRAVEDMLSSVMNGQSHVITVLWLDKFNSGRSQLRLIKVENGNSAIVAKLLRYRPGNIYIDPDPDLTPAQQNKAYFIRIEFRDRRAGWDIVMVYPKC